uniref:Uncharacterized protein n=1 Tax=Romanomermis culicivorax TaxID=13658 RepID=A0A915JYG2_ROMCU
MKKLYALDEHKIKYKSRMNFGRICRFWLIIYRSEKLFKSYRLFGTIFPIGHTDVRKMSGHLAPKISTDYVTYNKKSKGSCNLPAGTAASGWVVFSGLASGGDGDDISSEPAPTPLSSKNPNVIGGAAAAGATCCGGGASSTRFTAAAAAGGFSACGNGFG